MGEGRSHWSSMVLRKSQTCFFDRHTHPNSMYSNFCHVLKWKCSMIFYKKEVWNQNICKGVYISKCKGKDEEIDKRHNV